jgi:TolA-binding protein
MNRNIYFIFLIAVSLQAKEISVFGAGDIESSSPYGLTKSEKVILKNTNKIKSLTSKINNLEQNNENLNQKIDGIASVYENDSNSLNKAKQNLNELNNQLLTNTNTSNTLQEQILINSQNITKLDKKINDFILLQKKNNKSLFKSMKKLTYSVNKINKNYVSKVQFDELVGFVNNPGKKPLRSTIKKKTVSKSNKNTMKEAMVLFNKNYVTKSIPLFERLIKNKYKPAENSFYLGEVYFIKRKYKDAIHYYKKSMILNDQALYIPKLLLHSAMSFENTNDKENAINFYSTLVDAYPETKEAKVASKKLKKLN